MRILGLNAMATFKEICFYWLSCLFCCCCCCWKAARDYWKQKFCGKQPNEGEQESDEKLMDRFYNHCLQMFKNEESEANTTERVFIRLREAIKNRDKADLEKEDKYWKIPYKYWDRKLNDSGRALDDILLRKAKAIYNKPEDFKPQFHHSASFSTSTEKVENDNPARKKRKTKKKSEGLKTTSTVSDYKAIRCTSVKIDIEEDETNQQCEKFIAILRQVKEELYSSDDDTLVDISLLFLKATSETAGYFVDKNYDEISGSIDASYLQQCRKILERKSLTDEEKLAIGGRTRLIGDDACLRKLLSELIKDRLTGDKGVMHVIEYLDARDGRDLKRLSEKAKEQSGHVRKELGGLSEKYLWENKVTQYKATHKMGDDAVETKKNDLYEDIKTNPTSYFPYLNDTEKRKTDQEKKDMLSKGIFVDIDWTEIVKYMNEIFDGDYEGKKEELVKNAIAELDYNFDFRCDNMYHNKELEKKLRELYRPAIDVVDNCPPEIIEARGMIYLSQTDDTAEKTAMTTAKDYLHTNKGSIGTKLHLLSEKFSTEKVVKYILERVDKFKGEKVKKLRNDNVKGKKFEEILREITVEFCKNEVDGLPQLTQADPELRRRLQ
ncbi:uncharacterized protein LOC141907606 isoform X2 [Tubulanus polymorphus]|uniref:uncharacterized protein LOC141907606 isoform X2 n=1 Tax=Tubulanus polymorphus TaxID=672921 RepID=UPI003DA26A82